MHASAAILLVEDNEIETALLRRAFSTIGSTISLEHVWDGEEALRLLSSVARVPDLVITCINLPKFDGLILLEKLKGMKATRSIPVAILTNSEREEDRVKAFDSGAAGYFIKPTDGAGYDRLVRTVATYALAIRRKRDRQPTDLREPSKGVAAGLPGFVPPLGTRHAELPET